MWNNYLHNLLHFKQCIYIHIQNGIFPEIFYCLWSLDNHSLESVMRFIIPHGMIFYMGVRNCPMIPNFAFLTIDLWLWFTLWCCCLAYLVAFYDTLWIRRTYSRLKPPASPRGIRRTHTRLNPPPLPLGFLSGLKYHFEYVTIYKDYGLFFVFICHTN